MEQIGEAKLNMDAFRGEPVLTDAERLQDADLEQILQLVQEPDGGEADSWSKLYHLSELRENVLRPFFCGKQGWILEIGSGCGALTGLLAARADRIDCLDLSEKRCRINALRHRNCSALTVYAVSADEEGGFPELTGLLPAPAEEKYTKIVLEESAACRVTQKFLQNLLQNYLAPGGEIWIAADNRLGFQYLAGTPERLTGVFFAGLEGRPDNGPGDRSKKEWEELLSLCGISPGQRRFYYPYPDCRFTMALFSDARLPEPGELNCIDNNFERKRMRLFDDRKVQQTFLENDLFPQFSNSFLIQIRPDGRQNSFGSEQGAASPVYVKFSNERAADLSFYTVITEGHQVKKVPTAPEGRAHLEHIYRMQRKLEELYGDSVEVNRAALSGDELELEYVQGSTFETELDTVLHQQGTEAALRALHEYMNLVIPENYCTAVALDSGATGKDAQGLPAAYGQKTDWQEFSRVFGISPAAAFPEGIRTLPVSDIDLIPANMICSGTRKILLDYEWTFDFPVPSDYLRYRILHYYTEGPGRQELKKADLCQEFGLDRDCIPVYRAMEEGFQRYITGGKTAVRDLYQKISPGIWPVQILLAEQEAQIQKNGLHLYYSCGGDFTEEQSERFPLRDRTICLQKEIPQGVTQIRIDPGEESCICTVRKLELNGIPVKKPATNGRKLPATECYLFVHPDPWLVLRHLPGNAVLELEMEISPIGQEAMEQLRSLLSVRDPEDTAGQRLKQRVKKILGRCTE